MRFTSEQRLDDGVLERESTLGEIPAACGRLDPRRPLVLIGNPGGFHMRLPAGGQGLALRG